MKHLPIVRIGINPTTSRGTTERRVVCRRLSVSRVRAWSDGRVHREYPRHRAGRVCVVCCAMRAEVIGTTRAAPRARRDFGHSRDAREC